MSNNSSNSSSKGLGLTSILTIIFVIAKILGYINWSWWLVFSPTLIVIAFVILLVILGMIANS